MAGRRRAGRGGGRRARRAARSPPTDSSIAIGPEGGWSPSELALARDQISLGPNVLRVETAAVVAATLMVAHRVVPR